MNLLKKTDKFFCTFLMLNAFGIFFANAQVESNADKQVKFDAMAEAKQNGKVYHRITEIDSEIKLLPETAFSIQTKDYVFENEYEKAGFAAESLYYVKKSELVEKSTNEDKKKVDTGIDAVSKVLRSISKMKGMEYYSNTRKKWDTLYLESYRIENSYSTLALDDDLEGSADNKILYAYQVERSFGKGVYKIQYNENSNMVVMKMENVTNLAYGIIKAVKPGKLKIAVNVIDDGDGYFVYIAMCADFVQMSVFEKKMNKSFMARLDAIFKWITLQF